MLPTPRAREAQTPFRLNLSLQNQLQETAWNSLRPLAEWATGFSELERVYTRARLEPTLEGFLAQALLELGAEWSVSDSDRARIPTSGPCLVVANHPFGGLEGLVIGSLLRTARRDVRIIVNQLLSRIEPMRELMLPVALYDGRDDARVNGMRLREALRHLKGGGMLVVFPAGEVARFQTKLGRVEESAWHAATGFLARASGAPVLPVHFAGRAGALLHVAGLLHPRLLTAMLPRELLNQRGRRLEVRIGTPISPARLLEQTDDAERAAYLRRRTLLLAARPLTADASAQRARPALELRALNLPALSPGIRAPLAAAVDPSLLAAEIERLPAAQLLLQDRKRAVYFARAAQIHWTLREIGRLRELSFREAGEGSGRALDLDRFDARYVHLFTFDREARAIVGAYRLGLTDELDAPRELYTHTLFDMSRELFRRLGPAIELGRSFVAPRYQKSAAGLFLLWRGIGRFLAQNPRYRVLFGPVSISAEYTPASRALIVDFVTQGAHLHPLQRYVRARHPFARARTSFDSGMPSAARWLDIDEVSEAIADVEPDQKGAPVLLKHYLRLGGKMLGFNVDPSFSGVLDGLVLVDLAQTDPKILARYLGPSERS